MTCCCLHQKTITSPTPNSDQRNQFTKGFENSGRGGACSRKSPSCWQLSQVFLPEQSQLLSTLDLRRKLQAPPPSYAHRPITANAHTALSTRYNSNGRKNRTGKPKEQTERRTAVKPIPRVHLACRERLRGAADQQQQGRLCAPSCITQLFPQLENTSGATEEHAALRAYNWSRGQSEHGSTCLQLKKKTQTNKTKPKTSQTQSCRHFSSTCDYQYCKNRTINKTGFAPRFPTLTGPARWVASPRGMPFR